MASHQSLTHLHFDNGRLYKAWLDNQGYRTRKAGFTSDQYKVQQGADFLVNGHNDAERIAEIYSLMNQFAIDVATPHRTTRPSVRGGRVNMGAYLAGSPLDMYQRVTESSTHTPLRIWVGASSSAAIDESTLRKRGAALAAFALTLGEHRTVMLTQFTLNQGATGTGAIISCDLSTSPLVVSELAAHLDPLVTRYVGLHAGYCADTRSNGMSPILEESLTRQALGAAPDDIFLNGIMYHDPLTDNPVQWIKDNLARYLNPDAEA